MENYMLKKITNFSLDKNQDSQKNCLYLKNFIDNLIEQDLKLVFEKQSKNTAIRFSFAILEYMGKYKRSKKVVDLKLIEIK